MLLACRHMTFHRKSAKAFRSRLRHREALAGSTAPREGAPICESHGRVTDLWSYLAPCGHTLYRSAPAGYPDPPDCPHCYICQPVPPTQQAFVFPAPLLIQVKMLKP